MPSSKSKTRLAFLVSHPIQYYVPLYRALAGRDDIEIKVFFTWHAATAPVHDHGFNMPVAWDIPLTEGYEFEMVANVAADPGTHHFFGLRNPSLIDRIVAWRPVVVHVTGWAWQSHLQALYALHKKGVPILFRGDSHLLDAEPNGPRRWLKRAILKRVYSWPTAFLAVGAANRAYFEAFGVKPDRLFINPHSIDVKRFAEPAATYEQQAVAWRRQLGIADGQCVLLFAGKFERKKRPLELMRAVLALSDPALVLVLVGGGELEPEVKALAAAEPQWFRVLPFQNQSQMPIVYRLGDICVLPSAYGETWGLAINESLACGRPVLVSDKVGCAADVVDASCGAVFSWFGQDSLAQAVRDMTRDKLRLLNMRAAAAKRAWLFDISNTESTLLAAISRVRGL
jgi:glycosyltransferase involved in cell wall biosynthesis